MGMFWTKAGWGVGGGFVNCGLVVFLVRSGGCFVIGNVRFGNWGGEMMLRGEYLECLWGFGGVGVLWTIVERDVRWGGPRDKGGGVSLRENSFFW